MRSKLAINFILLLTALVLFCIDVQAQQHESSSIEERVVPPIPIEVFTSDEELSYLMIVNKPLADSKKITFFNVTSFKAAYDNDLRENEYIAQGLIQYELIRGLSIAGGITQHYRTGFRPTLGVNYTFANRKYLLVLLPRFDLTEDNNFETFGLFEFKPKLGKSIGLYSRVQGLYNWNTDRDFHDRSYIYFRLGLSVKSYQFGVGADFDTYGPMKLSSDSFGLFIRTQLFN